MLDQVFAFGRFLLDRWFDPGVAGGIVQRYGEWEFGTVQHLDQRLHNTIDLFIQL